MKQILGIMFLIFYTPVLMAGGFTVGNGGDLVICRNSVTQKQEYKSLDYLLTLRSLTDSDFLVIKKVEDSLLQIQNLLDQKLPELSGSFRQFVSYLWNENPKYAQIWEKAPFGVISISDEEIGSAHQLPASCLAEKQGKTSISLVQAVIRLREKFSQQEPKIFYAYMPEVIQEVEKKDPLQLSFLLVHEWLWEHSKHVERNRRINRLFHSPSFHQLSSEEIKSQLSSLGFVIPGKTATFFDNQFCQGTPSSIDELMLNKNRFRLGTYHILKRSRLCIPEKGCGTMEI